MATDVKLPELGEGVTEGELVKWLVKPGDTVKPDQPVAEVMTDKATVEVPTPVGGVVKDLKFKVGDTIAVEKTLLTLEGGSASAAPAKEEKKETAAPAAKAPPTVAKSVGTAQAPAQARALLGDPNSHAHPPQQASAPAGASSKGIYPPVADFRTLATPSTRRLARESGVDINSITGTGLAGRVTREDVLQSGGGLDMVPAAAGFKSPGIPRPGVPSLGAGAEERVPLRGIRKKIAENMQMSKHVIPHFTLMDEVNVTELVKMREGLKDFADKNKVKITYLPFVMKAVIATCRQFPMFNASIDDAAGEIVYKKVFNLGFAADTPNGLMVPVIKNADHKSILELSAEIIDLATRAREGKLKPDEMKGATITITNIGSVAGNYATPIINHPEVAILGMYKIADKVVVNPAGGFEAIKSMNFTVTCDHRLIDGAVAANFLKEFMAKIQNPARLMLDLA